MRQLRNTAALTSALLACGAAAVPAAHADTAPPPACAWNYASGTPAAPVIVAEQSGPAGQAVLSVAPSSATAEYSFDFGDLTTATNAGASVLHQYPSMGDWAVTATIVSGGTTKKISCSLTTLAVPSAEHRYGGNTRYDTNVAISQSLWDTAENGGYLPDPSRREAQAVVLASGDDYPDALAGAPLAAYKQAPLLLTPHETLRNTTEWEIRRVLPAGKTVYVLGGVKAVDPSVDARLRADGYQVTRIAGADRYQTALKIATAGLDSPAKVVVVTGHDFADALAAGPFATSTRETVDGKPAAILLTDGDVVSDPGTAAYIKARFTPHDDGNLPKPVIAAGGPAALALGKLNGTPLPPFMITCVGDMFQFEIAAGANRYATAACLAQQGPRVENPGASFNDTGATYYALANGSSFADALSGAGALAVTGGNILLTGTNSLPPETLKVMRIMLPGGSMPNGNTIDLDVLGGPQAVSLKVEAQMRAIAGF